MANLLGILLRHQHLLGGCIYGGLLMLLNCDISSANSTDAVFIHNQDQEEVLKKKLIPNPVIHLQADKEDKKVNTQTPADKETLPCFNIRKVSFNALPEGESLSQFKGVLTPFVRQSKDGHCMNINDINKLTSQVQNRLIDKGFVTTRVMVSDQELTKGELVLTIVVGRVGDILADTSKSTLPVYYKTQTSSQTTLPVNFSNALPLKKGDVLNIRHLETALENFKRVPSSDAKFELLPAQNGIIGQSDVLINYSQQRNLRTSLSIDDAGSKNTGSYQTNLSLSIDNPANLNDLFYVSYGYSFSGLNALKDKLNTHFTKEQETHKQNSHSYNIGYVIPFDNTLVSLSTGRFNYHQTVVGVNKDYVYGGQSQNHTLNVSYLAHRDQNSKTTLTLGGYAKAQKSFIDDDEIVVQRRKTAGWQTNIKHEASFGNTKAGITLGYQRGTGAFGAIVPYEKLFDEGDSQVGIITLDASLAHPFAKSKGKLSYDATLKGQYAKERLTPNERMSIGGRYSVRGFDGERTLSADDGILLRQNLNVALPALSTLFKPSSDPSPLAFFKTDSYAHTGVLYLGLDAGRVKMKDKAQDELLLGHSLVGSAIGIKGQFNHKTNPYKTLNYDLFASCPINAPKGFFGRDQTTGQDKDKEWVYGMSVGMGF